MGYFQNKWVSNDAIKKAKKRKRHPLGFKAKAVKMRRRYGTGLLNFRQHNISQACAKGFNSASQRIKASAVGFSNS